VDNKEILKKLKSPEYDFLRTDPRLKNIMLLTVGGSHAYGTNIETSDLDIRGIIAETIYQMLGFQTGDLFEQFNNIETDTTLYTFMKMIRLLVSCNPNVIEIMGTKKEQIYFISKEGQLLKDNLDIFLSQYSNLSFGGYANQQLRRLQNALARDAYPQNEKEGHILGSVNAQLNSIKKTYGDFTNEQINLYISKSSKPEFDSEIFMDVNMKHFPLRDFKNIYSQMNNVVKDYDKLNHRNTKKDELHLNKHIMHLVRLYIMFCEISEGKGVNTFRPERDFLLNLRCGDYVDINPDGSKNYERVFQIINKYEKRFQYAMLHSVLPLEPDIKKVNELTMEINTSLLRSYGV
jgi:predicted nucleotidyltransferase